MRNIVELMMPKWSKLCRQ